MNATESVLQLPLKLEGEDGNGMAIIARATRIMRTNKVATSMQTEFTRQAMSGNHDNLLRTCMKWFDCD